MKVDREHEVTVKICNLTAKGKSEMIKRLKRWIFLWTIGIPCVIEITDEEGVDIRQQYNF